MTDGPNKPAAPERRDSASISVEHHWRGVGEPDRSLMSNSTHLDTLVGIWGTYNPGGGTDETLVLFPDGAGALDYYNMGAYCGRETFRWAVADDTHLRFEGYINIFRVESAEVEIEDYVRGDGEKTKMLSVFPRGKEARPEQFVKSPESVESYEIPQEARER